MKTKEKVNEQQTACQNYDLFLKTVDDVFLRHRNIPYFLDDVHLSIPRKQNMKSTLKQLFSSQVFTSLLISYQLHITNCYLLKMAENIATTSSCHKSGTKMDGPFERVNECVEDIIIISDDSDSCSEMDVHELHMISDDSDGILEMNVYDKVVIGDSSEDDDVYVISDSEDDEDGQRISPEDLQAIYNAMYSDSDSDHERESAAHLDTDDEMDSDSDWMTSSESGYESVEE